MLLRTENLTKDYGRFRALDALDIGGSERFAGNENGILRTPLAQFLKIFANDNDVARRIRLTHLFKGRIRKGHKVLLQGVGGGFTWGAALVEM